MFLVAGCATADTSATDRQAHIIGLAIELPRSADANGLARNALAAWKGAPNELAVLEATDLHPTSTSEPAARLVIRIHTAAHQSNGEFGDGDRPARDACYRLEYLMPSSSEVGEPVSVDCPAGATAYAPPSAAPEPHLPADAATRLAKVLAGLPAHPTSAQALAAVRRGFPAPHIIVTVEVDGDRVAVAAGVRHPNGPDDCAIELRTGRRIASYSPEDPVVLMPGESGCVADLAIHPVLTH